MNVPLVDLKAQCKDIGDEVVAEIKRVMESCAFAGGPFVERFEEEFASFCRCKHAIGLGSGTEALWLVLLASGIGPGDEVITVPNTFIATAEAISFCGAKPVFVDIDEKTYTMNPDLLARAITPRTKAIIPVHLFGQMAEMDPIMEFAEKKGLLVIEDACQAHGARYKDRPAGSIGDAGCFSFYPGKNLGAYGEAGAIVTNNTEIDSRVRILRDHGQPKKYYHDMIGWNARMDGLQGAILSVKLKFLEQWNDARRKYAALYNNFLAELDGIIIPHEADYARHVYHIYAIRVQNRDVLIDALAKEGIHCGIHYPVPVHLQEAYRFLWQKKGSFPLSEKCAEELVSLPMYPEIGEELITYVANKIIEFYNNELPLKHHVLSNSQRILTL
jgi:dTDP-4-amino-4,6-dideoxygalactose transaminase